MKLVIAEKIAEYINVISNNLYVDHEEHNKAVCSRMMVLRNELVFLLDRDLYKLVMEVNECEKQADVWDVLLEIRTSLGLAEGELTDEDAVFHAPGIGGKK